MRERTFLVSPISGTWVVALLLAAGAAVLVAAAVRDRSPTPARAESASRPDSKQQRLGRHTDLEWGLYHILWSRHYGRQLQTSLARFDSKPDYIMFYRDLGRRYPEFAINPILREGATPIVSLELWHWHDRGRVNRLGEIVDGKYDEYFRQWAQAAKAGGRRVLLRFGFEMNGSWFSWSGDPKDFVATWRRVHDIFAEVGAENVEWVWAPNFVSIPETPKNDMHLYYPGDDYVDWVALDGYNFGDDHDEWHKWSSFEECLGPQLRDFARHYPNKPIMLAEFGSAVGKPGQKAAWIRDAYQQLSTRHPHVKAVIWFDYDKTREGEPNFRIDSSAQSLKAFNETFARPRE